MDAVYLAASFSFKMDCALEKHEQKFCPRCKEAFTCKVGDVANCQCSNVPLVPEERTYFMKKYSDCLCAACMKELKSEYAVHLFNRKLRLLRVNGTYPSE